MAGKKSGEEKKDIKKIEDKPKRIDDKIKEFEKRSEEKKQEERLKEREEKKEPGDPIKISESVLEQLKDGIKRIPFVVSGGMWKTIVTAYNSCTDEFGRLQTDVETLKDKVYSAQKHYFKKNFGEWKIGTQKDISATLGDLTYKQYLGNIDQAFKPLAEIPKDQLTPKTIVDKVLEPLVSHYSERMIALNQQGIIGLPKDKKEKLKKELVERSKAIGRSLLPAELLSDESLVKAVYGVIGEERSLEYKSSKKGKSLLEGLDYEG